jgi:uncharacterized protein (TIGR01777 family)
MRIIISGASGLVGKALTEVLRNEGDTVKHLVRDAGKESAGAGGDDIQWDPTSAQVDVPALENTDAVVHLSGASVADGRWTEARKQVLRSSRLDTTRILVDSLARLNRKPKVFICASAVGYYGNRGDEILTESSATGTDFLALLARDWESEAIRAQTSGGIRTVILRFGVILAADGGALPKMLAPFRIGAGGPLGNGRQWQSWIALEDVIGAIRFAIDNAGTSGPVNVVSPNPVRNAEFTQTAAKVLHRPAIFPAPAFALRLAFGEMADALLLASQRVQPRKLLEAAYQFRHTELEETLRTILR